MGHLPAQACVPPSPLLPPSLRACADVQTFVLVHLLTKFGTAANDAATSLKLLEKGLKKEDLALAVLIDFPFQIVFGYLAAKWSKGDKPLKPVRSSSSLAFLKLELTSAVDDCHVDPPGVGSGLHVPHRLLSPKRHHVVLLFPRRSLHRRLLLLLVRPPCPPPPRSVTDRSVGARTVQFVGISAFHTQIADPLIGGTYMTLLNTVSNLGGTWPRFFVLKGVDAFSLANCVVKNDSLDLIVTGPFLSSPPSATGTDPLHSARMRFGSREIGVRGFGRRVRDR